MKYLHFSVAPHPFLIAKIVARPGGIPNNHGALVTPEWHENNDLSKSEGPSTACSFRYDFGQEKSNYYRFMLLLQAHPFPEDQSHGNCPEDEISMVGQRCHSSSMPTNQSSRRGTGALSTECGAIRGVDSREQQWGCRYAYLNRYGFGSLRDHRIRNTIMLCEWISKKIIQKHKDQ